MVFLDKSPHRRRRRTYLALVPPRSFSQTAFASRCGLDIRFHRALPPHGWNCVVAYWVPGRTDGTERLESSGYSCSPNHWHSHDHRCGCQRILYEEGTNPTAQAIQDTYNDCDFGFGVPACSDVLRSQLLCPTLLPDSWVERNHGWCEAASIVARLIPFRRHQWSRGCEDGSLSSDHLDRLVHHDSRICQRFFFFKKKNYEPDDFL